MKNVHILVQRWFANGEGWAYNIGFPEAVRLEATDQISELAGQFKDEVLTKTVRIGDWYMYIRVEPDQNCVVSKGARHPHIDIGILSDEELDDAKLNKLFQQAYAFEKRGAASNMYFADHNTSKNFSWTSAVLLVLLLCIGGVAFVLWKNQDCSSQVSEKTTNSGTNTNPVSNEVNKNPKDAQDASVSNTVASQIELWNQFEDNFKQLSSNFEKGNATVSDCTEFLNKYDNAEKFDGYDRYKTTIIEVQEIQSAIERRERIEELCKNFDMFERDYKSDDSQFKTIFDNIKYWKLKLIEFSTDPKIQIRLLKLSDIEKMNLNKWEEAECEKFRYAEQSFNNNKSIAKIADVILAAKDYLEEQDSPKLHANEILKQKQAYDVFQAAFTFDRLTITLVSYDVIGTRFNNLMLKNNLDFNFSIGGAISSIQLRGVGGTGSGLNRDINIPLNIASALTIELVNLDWANQGARGQESINFLDEIWAGNNSIQKTCLIIPANGGEAAKVSLIISGLPTPPRPLVLDNIQVE